MNSNFLGLKDENDKHHNREEEEERGIENLHLENEHHMKTKSVSQNIDTCKAHHTAVLLHNKIPSAMWHSIKNCESEYEKKMIPKLSLKMIRVLKRFCRNFLKKRFVKTLIDIDKDVRKVVDHEKLETIAENQLQTQREKVQKSLLRADRKGKIFVTFDERLG
jgi:hypothetical protein